MPFGAVAAIGAAFGTAFGALAEKFSPLDDDEILAAESLGLNFDAIMREIVIPSARLGILMRLNRRRQKFK
jgi:ABC-type spermidine/putrescine transport system permease subunit II